MEQEVLTIQVQITGATRVQGAHGEANLVSFTGQAEGPLFRGDILPGGVDTQRREEGRFTLSARYLLEGTDAEGHPGRIFIENNGETTDLAAPMTTRPCVRTDCPSLQWLETADLRGTLEPRGPQAVCIHIFAR